MIHDTCTCTKTLFWKQPYYFYFYSLQTLNNNFSALMSFNESVGEKRVSGRVIGNTHLFLAWEKIIKIVI